MRAQQDRLEGQPLGDEAVERRQRRDRRAADKEDEGRLRHAMDEAAEALHVALAGRGEHRAGAEEQQTLEDRMVEDVQEAGGERERRRQRHAVGLERERKAEPDEDDPDVLHRVVREQPLEVVLHERVEHAHDGGDAAEREHHHAPPPGGRAEQIEDDAHEAVDGDLGHHAAHQRRDVARRRRMRERQPDMQRHEAGFGAGADQGQDRERRPRLPPTAAPRGFRQRHNRHRDLRAVRTPAAARACRSSP